MAEDIYWAPSGSYGQGDYNTPSNWATRVSGEAGRVPGATDRAVIDQTFFQDEFASYPEAFVSAATTSQQLLVLNNYAYLYLNGAQLNLSGTGTATPSIAISNNGYLGAQGDGSSASILHAAGDTIVGQGSSGTLYVQSSLHFSSDGALAVGSGSGGHGFFSDYGTTTSGSGQIGVGGGYGYTSVYGYDSPASWTTGALGVGVDPLADAATSYSGQLLVQRGGQLSTRDAVIGDHANAFGTASVYGVSNSGTAAQWTTNSQSLTVGNAGTGSLDVQDAGKVSDSIAYLGYDSGSTGMATVTGAGSTWTNTSALEVGVYGAGTLSVQGGGTFSVSRSGNALFLDFAPGGPTPSATPEPGSLSLIALGGLGLVGYARRRRKPIADTAA